MLGVLLIVVLVVPVALLYELRRRQDNRRIATIYFAACGGAIIASRLHVIGAWTGADYQHSLMATECAVAITFAYGATRSSLQRCAGWGRA